MVRKILVTRLGLRSELRGFAPIGALEYWSDGVLGLIQVACCVLNGRNILPLDGL